MKIYVYDYPSHAGKWIYSAYHKAWAAKGFDVVKIPVDKSISETVNTSEEYMLMVTDVSANGPGSLEVVEKSYKTFMYAQPNQFPRPWGAHPNFVSLASPETISNVNKLENVVLWTFGDDTKSYHTKWKEVNSIPLAFDSIGYTRTINEKYKKFDICFVGGWANNGFDEKRKIMIDIFSHFKKSELKCAFAIEKNLSHEQETELISSSRVTLNIHDAYQRILGTDTNERTFKTLGLNGCLVSDTVGQLNRLFPELETSLDSQEIVEITKQYVQLTDVELNDIKEKNIQNILENHCYTNRVESLLSL
jgi:spore maturation protein CgeB